MTGHYLAIESAIVRSLKLSSDHAVYRVFKSDADEDEAVRRLSDMATALHIAIKALRLSSCGGSVDPGAVLRDIARTVEP